MKTVPKEVSTAVFNMEDVIGSIRAALCTLKIMQDRINTSSMDDADALCWVVTNLITDVCDLSEQWNALFRMTRETGSREGGAA